MNENMNQYLSNKFRWLSLIATWAVVGIHSRTYSEAAGGINYSTRVQDISTDLFRFAVPLFFVISGYMFVSSFEKHGWMSLLRRKIKSLYLPMVIWGAIGLVMFLPIRIYINEDVPTVFDFLKLPLLALSSGGGHFWYVRVLIVMFVCAPVVYYVARHIWAAVLCIVVALLIPEDSVCAQLHVPVAIIFITLGIQLSIHWRGNGMFKGGWCCFIFSLAGLVLSFLFKAQITTHYFLILFEPLFMIGVVWFGYDIIDRIRPIGKFPEKLNVLFFVYCMHIIILYWSRGVLRVALGTSPFMSLVRYFILLQTFWLDIIIANGIRRFFPRMFTVLAGGR